MKTDWRDIKNRALNQVRTQVWNQVGDQIWNELNEKAPEGAKEN